jgi:predicted enzyme related to lactoylglutathione lyase
MAAFSEGTPCWTDVTLPDLEAGKRFYGELFGWTFGTSSPEYGGYTQASSDGKAVAALAPQMPGQGLPPAWTLYLASPEVRETAARAGAHGGRVELDPMRVGDFGSMAVLRDPAGVLVGVWEAGAHEGFGAQGGPGAYCWAEVRTPDPDGADAFFPPVFGYDARRMAGPPETDYLVWHVDDAPVLGRYRLPAAGGAAPAEAPHIEVFFAVEDCDAAVATVQRLGGRLVSGPEDSPYGRFAAVADPQGAAFTVMDLSTTVGKPPAVG